MRKSQLLNTAKMEKNDEYYTLYSDIENEINEHIKHTPDIFKNKTILCPCDDPELSNFPLFFTKNIKRLGIKKVIITSYGMADNQDVQTGYLDFLMDDVAPKKGKVCIYEPDTYPVETHKDLQWKYLNGDGDFRSPEVYQLQKQADIVITNPPFSLFREFVEWNIQNGKQFLIIGNQNAFSCKDVFTLFQTNKMTIGFTKPTGFIKPNNYKDKKDVGGAMTRWFTNFTTMPSKPFLSLKTMEENKQLNKSVIKHGYNKYDNFDALDVPEIKAIPSDYTGVMGVPITFLDYYNPEQFDILGLERYTAPKDVLTEGRLTINGEMVYARILIKPHRTRTEVI